MLIRARLLWIVTSLIIITGQVYALEPLLKCFQSGSTDPFAYYDEYGLNNVPGSVSQNYLNPSSTLILDARSIWDVQYYDTGTANATAAINGLKDIENDKIEYNINVLMIANKTNQLSVTTDSVAIMQLKSEIAALETRNTELLGRINAAVATADSMSSLPKLYPLGFEDIDERAVIERMANRLALINLSNKKFNLTNNEKIGIEKIGVTPDYLFSLNLYDETLETKGIAKKVTSGTSVKYEPLHRITETVGFYIPIVKNSYLENNYVKFKTLVEREIYKLKYNIKTNDVIYSKIEAKHTANNITDMYSNGFNYDFEKNNVMTYKVANLLSTGEKVNTSPNMMINTSLTSTFTGAVPPSNVITTLDATSGNKINYDINLNTNYSYIESVGAEPNKISSITSNDSTFTFGVNTANEDISYKLVGEKQVGSLNTNKSSVNGVQNITASMSPTVSPFEMFTLSRNYFNGEGNNIGSIVYEPAGNTLTTILTNMPGKYVGLFWENDFKPLLTNVYTFNSTEFNTLPGYTKNFNIIGYNAKNMTVTNNGATKVKLAPVSNGEILYIKDGSYTSSPNYDLTLSRSDMKTYKIDGVIKLTNNNPLYNMSYSFSPANTIMTYTWNASPLNLYVVNGTNIISSPTISKDIRYEKNTAVESVAISNRGVTSNATAENLTNKLKLTWAPIMFNSYVDFKKLKYYSVYVNNTLVATTSAVSFEMPQKVEDYIKAGSNISVTYTYFNLKWVGTFPITYLDEWGPPIEVNNRGIAFNKENIFKTEESALQAECNFYLSMVNTVSVKSAVTNKALGGLNRNYKVNIKIPVAAESTYQLLYTLYAVKKGFTGATTESSSNFWDYFNIFNKNTGVFTTTSTTFPDINSKMNEFFTSRAKVELSSLLEGARNIITNNLGGSCDSLSLGVIGSQFLTKAQIIANLKDMLFAKSLIVKVNPLGSMSSDYLAENNRNEFVLAPQNTEEVIIDQSNYKNFFSLKDDGDFEKNSSVLKRIFGDEPVGTNLQVMAFYSRATTATTTGGNFLNLMILPKKNEQVDAKYINESKELEDLIQRKYEKIVTSNAISIKSDYNYGGLFSRNNLFYKLNGLQKYNVNYGALQGENQYQEDRYQNQFELQKAYAKYGIQGYDVKIDKVIIMELKGAHVTYLNPAIDPIYNEDNYIYRNDYAVVPSIVLDVKSLDGKTHKAVIQGISYEEGNDFKKGTQKTYNDQYFTYDGTTVAFKETFPEVKGEEVFLKGLWNPSFPEQGDNFLTKGRIIYSKEGKLSERNTPYLSNHTYSTTATNRSIVHTINFFEYSKPTQLDVFNIKNTFRFDLPENPAVFRGLGNRQFVNVAVDYGITSGSSIEAVRAIPWYYHAYNQNNDFNLTVGDTVYHYIDATSNLGKMLLSKANITGVEGTISSSRDIVAFQPSVGRKASNEASVNLIFTKEATFDRGYINLTNDRNSLKFVFDYYNGEEAYLANYPHPSKEVYDSLPSTFGRLNEVFSKVEHNEIDYSLAKLNGISVGLDKTPLFNYSRISSMDIMIKQQPFAVDMSDTDLFNLKISDLGLYSNTRTFFKDFIKQGTMKFPSILLFKPREFSNLDSYVIDGFDFYQKVFRAPKYWGLNGTDDFSKPVILTNEIINLLGDAEVVKVDSRQDNVLKNIGYKNIQAVDVPFAYPAVIVGYQKAAEYQSGSVPNTASKVKTVDLSPLKYTNIDNIVVDFEGKKYFISINIFDIGLGRVAGDTGSIFPVLYVRNGEVKDSKNIAVLKTDITEEFYKAIELKVKQAVDYYVKSLCLKITQENKMDRIDLINVSASADLVGAGGYCLAFPSRDNLVRIQGSYNEVQFKVTYEDTLKKNVDKVLENWKIQLDNNNTIYKSSYDFLTCIKGLYTNTFNYNPMSKTLTVNIPLTESMFYDLLKKTEDGTYVSNDENNVLFKVRKGIEIRRKSDDIKIMDFGGGQVDSSKIKVDYVGRMMEEQVNTFIPEELVFDLHLDMTEKDYVDIHVGDTPLPIGVYLSNHDYTVQVKFAKVPSVIPYFESDKADYLVPYPITRYDIIDEDHALTTFAVKSKMTTTDNVTDYIKFIDLMTGTDLTGTSKVTEKSDEFINTFITSIGKNGERKLLNYSIKNILIDKFYTYIVIPNKQFKLSDVDVKKYKKYGSADRQLSGIAFLGRDEDRSYLKVKVKSTPEFKINNVITEVMVGTGYKKAIDSTTEKAIYIELFNNLGNPVNNKCMSYYDKNDKSFTILYEIDNNKLLPIFKLLKDGTAGFDENEVEKRLPLSEATLVEVYNSSPEYKTKFPNVAEFITEMRNRKFISLGLSLRYETEDGFYVSDEELQTLYLTYNDLEMQSTSNDLTDEVKAYENSQGEAVSNGSYTEYFPQIVVNTNTMFKKLEDNFYSYSNYEIKNNTNGANLDSNVIEVPENTTSKKLKIAIIPKDSIGNADAESYLDYINFDRYMNRDKLIVYTREEVLFSGEIGNYLAPIDANNNFANGPKRFIEVDIEKVLGKQINIKIFPTVRVRGSFKQMVLQAKNYALKQDDKMFAKPRSTMEFVLNTISGKVETTHENNILNYVTESIYGDFYIKNRYASGETFEIKSGAAVKFDGSNVEYESREITVDRITKDIDRVSNSNLIKLPVDGFSINDNPNGIFMNVLLGVDRLSETGAYNLDSIYKSYVIDNAAYTSLSIKPDEAVLDKITGTKALFSLSKQFLKDSQLRIINSTVYRNGFEVKIENGIPQLTNKMLQERLEVNTAILDTKTNYLNIKVIATKPVTSISALTVELKKADISYSSTIPFVEMNTTGTKVGKIEGENYSFMIMIPLKKFILDSTMTLQSAIAGAELTLVTGDKSKKYPLSFKTMGSSERFSNLDLQRMVVKYPNVEDIQVSTQEDSYNNYKVNYLFRTARTELATDTHLTVTGGLSTEGIVMDIKSIKVKMNSNGNNFYLTNSAAGETLANDIYADGISITRDTSYTGETQELRYYTNNGFPYKNLSAVLAGDSVILQNLESFNEVNPNLLNTDDYVILINKPTTSASVTTDGSVAINTPYNSVGTVVAGEEPSVIGKYFVIKSVGVEYNEGNSSEKKDGAISDTEITFYNMRDGKYRATYEFDNGMVFPIDADFLNYYAKANNRDPKSMNIGDYEVYLKTILLANNEDELLKVLGEGYDRLSDGVEAQTASISARRDEYIRNSLDKIITEVQQNKVEQSKWKLGFSAAKMAASWATTLMTGDLSGNTAQAVVNSISVVELAATGEASFGAGVDIFGVTVGSNVTVSLSDGIVDYGGSLGYGNITVGYSRNNGPKLDIDLVKSSNKSGGSGWSSGISLDAKGAYVYNGYKDGKTGISLQVKNGYTYKNWDGFDIKHWNWNDFIDRAGDVYSQANVGYSNGQLGLNASLNSEGNYSLGASYGINNDYVQSSLNAKFIGNYKTNQDTVLEMYIDAYKEGAFISGAQMNAYARFGTAINLTNGDDYVLSQLAVDGVNYLNRGYTFDAEGNTKGFVMATNTREYYDNLYKLGTKIGTIAILDAKAKTEIKKALNDSSIEVQSGVMNKMPERRNEVEVAFNTLSKYKDKTPDQINSLSDAEKAEYNEAVRLANKYGYDLDNLAELEKEVNNSNISYAKLIEEFTNEALRKLREKPAVPTIINGQVISNGKINYSEVEAELMRNAQEMLNNYHKELYIKFQNDVLNDGNGANLERVVQNAAKSLVENPKTNVPELTEDDATFLSEIVGKWNEKYNQHIAIVGLDGKSRIISAPLEIPSLDNLKVPTVFAVDSHRGAKTVFILDPNSQDGYKSMGNIQYADDKEANKFSIFATKDKNGNDVVIAVSEDKNVGTDSFNVNYTDNDGNIVSSDAKFEVESKSGKVQILTDSVDIEESLDFVGADFKINGKNQAAQFDLRLIASKSLAEKIKNINSNDRDELKDSLESVNEELKKMKEGLISQIQNVINNKINVDSNYQDYAKIVQSLGDTHIKKIEEYISTLSNEITTIENSIRSGDTWNQDYVKEFFKNVANKLATNGSSIFALDADGKLISQSIGITNLLKYSEEKKDVNYFTRINLEEQRNKYLNVDIIEVATRAKNDNKITQEQLDLISKIKGSGKKVIAADLVKLCEGISDPELIKELIYPILNDIHANAYGNSSKINDFAGLDSSFYLSEDVNRVLMQLSGLDSRMGSWNNVLNVYKQNYQIAVKKIEKQAEALIAGNKVAYYNETINHNTYTNMINHINKYLAKPGANSDVVTMLRIAMGLEAGDIEAAQSWLVANCSSVANEMKYVAADGTKLFMPNTWAICFETLDKRADVIRELEANKAEPLKPEYNDIDIRDSSGKIISYSKGNISGQMNRNPMTPEYGYVYESKQIEIKTITGLAYNFKPQTVDNNPVAVMSSSITPQVHQNEVFGPSVSFPTTPIVIPRTLYIPKVNETDVQVMNPRDIGSEQIDVIRDNFTPTVYGDIEFESDFHIKIYINKKVE